MTTDPSIIREKVKSYITQVVNTEKQEIDYETPILKGGYLDSMGFISLVSYIEEEFGLKSTDTDLVEENFKSINAISDFIIRKTSQ